MGVGDAGVTSFTVLGSPNMSVIEESSMVTAESLEEVKAVKEVSVGEGAVAAPITLSNRNVTKCSEVGFSGRGWWTVGMERVAGLGMNGTVLLSKILKFEAFSF